MIRLLLILTVLLLPALPANAAGAPAIQPPLKTPWTDMVNPGNALPEYPRPQLVRPDWQNLNGTWQFTGSASIDNPPIGHDLPESVLVPYPIESGLSGIQRHESSMFYRRTFTVPSGWAGRRVKLNFGAVNWRAKVWVNGQLAGEHTGAYDPFSFDITPALNGGTNELIVGVHSPVDTAGQPLGKQRLDPSGIFYTAASGIWQTAWLEPVAAAHITRLDTTPDVAGGVLDLVVKATGGGAVHASVLSGGQEVASGDGAAGSHIRIPIPNARLWSPDDPFLYDLRVSLAGGDVVSGYFGMRSVGKAFVDGQLRMVLNGRFVFNAGTLDQGYWPDGIYTAPTDAALRFDLERQKALGFNTVRKHIKVEPARWFYHADRLGLMVWQDMPSMRLGPAPSAADRATFESELFRMVDHLRGITSITMWIPFNEGWGQYDGARIADLVKGWDPTRLVNNNSGGNCCGYDAGNGDLVDDHNYVGPGTTRPPSDTRAAVLGEFGSIGMHVPANSWPGDPVSAELHPNSAALTNRIEQLMKAVKPLIAGRGLSASIFTQPVDVENEVNGLYTYDRKLLKVDGDRIRAVNQALIAVGRAAEIGRPISLRVTTPGHTNRYAGFGVTHAVDANSPAALRKETTFWVRQGLADASCVSFESRANPGRFLRHRDFRVYVEPSDGSALFNADATFCAGPGRSGTGISYESFNLPGHYLRHANAELSVAVPSGGSFDADASWQQAQAWWRSGADLTIGQNISLRVITACCTDRYLRHQDSLALTEVVTAQSTPLLKQDATFTVRPGLADTSCYSLESRNYPGHYLRHSGYRVRKDARDGTALFDADATFCARPGLSAGGVSLESANYPGYHVRHALAAVYIAGKDGINPFDSPATYEPDSTWAVTAPWAP